MFGFRYANVASVSKTGAVDFASGCLISPDNLK